MESLTEHAVASLEKLLRSGRSGLTCLKVILERREGSDKRSYEIADRQIVDVVKKVITEQVCLLTMI